MEIQSNKIIFQVIKEAKETYDILTEISNFSKLELYSVLLQKKTVRIKGKNFIFIIVQNFNIFLKRLIYCLF